MSSVKGQVHAAHSMQYACVPSSCRQEGAGGSRCNPETIVSISPSSLAGAQVAHVSGDVEFLEPKEGKVTRGWAAAPVATTADFSHGSWFWTQFSGGLNYQVHGTSMQLHAPCST